MTLEDFERSLAEEKSAKESHEIRVARIDSRKRRKHNHHHHHHRGDDDKRRHKRSKHSKPCSEDEHEHRPSRRSEHTQPDDAGEEWVEKDAQQSNKGSPRNFQGGRSAPDGLKRDTWMQEPSTLDIDYTQRGIQKPPESANTTSSKADFQLKIHVNELNKHHLQDLADGKEIPDDVANQPAQYAVDYVFGDSGAQWRMTKLKGVYRRAQESGRELDEVATEQYGDLRAFDDAREEETELERRKTYGEGYVGKDRPSGELFQERKLKMGVRDARVKSTPTEPQETAQFHVANTATSSGTAKPIDQTALNRLKAQMMKAKLKGSAEASKLESDYNEALRSFAGSTDASTVVLGAMESRMLTGGRHGEVKAVENKRGRERGLVEENEEMSIEDMVKQERRTRNEHGGDGQRFAERIAKDAKFDASLPCWTIILHVCIC